MGILLQTKYARLRYLVGGFLRAWMETSRKFHSKWQRCCWVLLYIFIHCACSSIYSEISAWEAMNLSLEGIMVWIPMLTIMYSWHLFILLGSCFSLPTDSSFFVKMCVCVGLRQTSYHLQLTQTSCQLLYALELLSGQLALESINSDDIERVFCCHLRNMQSRHHRRNKFGSKWCVKHAIKASPGSIRFVKLAQTIAKIRERTKKAMLNPKVRHMVHACTSF